VIVLANVVLIGAHHGLPYASLDLQSALISEVRSWQDPGALARYDIERARLCNDVGLVNEAHSALSDGRRILRQISDPSNRAIFESDLEIEEARAMIGTSPQEAARILASVVDSMRARTGEFKLAEVLLDLGRARQRAGDARGALTAWLAGIDTFERQRQAISGEALRIGFYSRAWELYDYAIAEALSERDDRAALSLVERSRARALRDAMDPFGRPVDIGEVQSRLSLGTALLTFAIVRGSLLAWCIDRSHVTFAQLAYGADALQEEVQALRREILERGSMQSAARFTRAINAAFGSQLDTATRIVVVPDGPLSGVPFSALPWKDGRQAVDHFSVSLAPSLSVFERASRDQSSIAGSPPKRAALIGDPTIDRRLYPSLNQLPSARREVIESARWYPRSRIFVGAAATASRVTEAIGSADVIHFAGHAIANPDFPLKAALVVAPDGNRPGHMRPSDLEPRRNSRTRLVILSACSTAQATPVFGEGALSLARPFLAAGVPDVLGTIWDVDDGDAAALVPRFHRWLRMGIEPAEALRRAQLELKTGPDPSLRAPRAWSGFVIIGGSYLHNMSSSR
jgi:CHAT domain-containing protein